MIRRFIFLSTACILPAGAVTISFQEGVSPGGYDHIAKDIRSQPASNNGAQMLVGNQPGGVGNIRALMAFGLGAIPAGSIINSISLTLVTDTADHSGTVAGVGTINIHELTPNGLRSNNITDSGALWDVWNGTTAWSTPGGDYDSTVMSTSVVNDANNDTKLRGETATFGSTASFVAAAQLALDSGLPLEFILIAPTAEAGTTPNFFRFASDNFATTSQRPLLVIDYTIPEPSTVLLACFAGCGALVRRRR